MGGGDNSGGGVFHIGSVDSSGGGGKRVLLGRMAARADLMSACGKMEAVSGPPMDGSHYRRVGRPQISSPRRRCRRHHRLVCRRPTATATADQAPDRRHRKRRCVVATAAQRRNFTEHRANERNGGVLNGAENELFVCLWYELFSSLSSG